MSSVSPDQAIAGLAGAQRGVFTWDQALGCGLSPEMVRTRVATAGAGAPWPPRARQNDLVVDGWTLLRSPYHEIKYRPDAARTVILRTIERLHRSWKE